MDDDFLVRKGFITREQLEEALRVRAEASACSLQSVLDQLGLKGEKAQCQAKSLKLGYGFVDLERITEELPTNVVIERLCRQHMAIPVKKDGTNLWVAMADPSDKDAREDLRLCSGCRIIPVTAVPSDIEAAIERAYSNGT